MRQRNWRSVLTGVLFIFIAVGLYLFLLGIAGQSTDPAEVMRTIGGFSGAMIGVSVALIIAGLIGKKVN